MPVADDSKGNFVSAAVTTLITFTLASELSRYPIIVVPSNESHDSTDSTILLGAKDSGTGNQRRRRKHCLTV